MNAIEVKTDERRMHDVSGDWFKSPVVYRSVIPAPYFAWSGMLNRLIAAILLLPAIPFMLLAVVAIRLTSVGPAVYRQIRVGRDRKLFTIYKLRSMYIDAERQTGAVWTTDTRDPRITPVGRILRASHIDELPQLFNVLFGQMALVGPRPERPEFTESLADAIPGYWDRLLVLPGVTGLAQVNLPPDSDLDSVRKKIVLDCEYIENATIGMDLLLIFCTIGRLIGLRPHCVVRWVRLDRQPNIDCVDDLLPTSTATENCRSPCVFRLSVCALRSLPLTLLH